MGRCCNWFFTSPAHFVLASLTPCRHRAWSFQSYRGRVHSPQSGCMWLYVAVLFLILMSFWRHSDVICLWGFGCRCCRWCFGPSHGWGSFSSWAYACWLMRRGAFVQCVAGEVFYHVLSYKGFKGKFYFTGSSISFWMPRTDCHYLISYACVCFSTGWKQNSSQTQYLRKKAGEASLQIKCLTVTAIEKGAVLECHHCWSNSGFILQHTNKLCLN